MVRVTLTLGHLGHFMHGGRARGDVLFQRHLDLTSELNVVILRQLVS